MALKTQNKSTLTFAAVMQLLLGLLAVLAVKSIFENDNSRIVSKKGQKLLSNEKEMMKIREKIKQMESIETHDGQREIVV